MKLPLFAQTKDGKWVLLPTHKFKYFDNGAVGISNDDVRGDRTMIALMNQLADVFTVTPQNWMGSEYNGVTTYLVKATLTTDQLATFTKAVEKCDPEGGICQVCARFKLRK